MTPFVSALFGKVSTETTCENQLTVTSHRSLPLSSHWLVTVQVFVPILIMSIVQIKLSVFTLWDVKCLCFVSLLYIQCSKTCEGGFRVREVRCLSDDMMSSDACDQQLKPAEKEDCNPEPCIPQIGQWCCTIRTYY